MSSSPSRHVLVTGGAGYIGSHACKALSLAGFTPVTYDNLSLGHADFVKWGPLVQGDTRDAAAVAAAIRDHDTAAVVHFAARSLVGESMTDPAAYYDNNVGGIMGILAGMREAGCNRLVFSSTAAVYGEAGDAPIREDALALPVNPYGQSKLMCEAIIADHVAAYDMQAVILRYFNASGADPDGEIGEYRAVETHLIPRAMMALQGYIDDFRVFGSDFPTPDGTAIRDYIHVADLAEAHVLALTAMIDGLRFGRFNLGIGKGYSVGEVLRAVAHATGRPMDTPSGPRRAGDPVRLVADATAAAQTLGFAPSRSDLDTIVGTAWRWHQRAHPLRNSTPVS